MRLYKRDNGIWYAEFGRGRKRSLKTRDEAVARSAFRELKKKFLEQKLFLIKKEELVTLEKFKQEYLEIRKDKSKNTQRADKLALQKLIDWYGNKAMRGLTAKKLSEFRTHLYKQQRKASSVNVYIRHLKIAIKTAIRWGYIPLAGEGTSARDRQVHPLEDFKEYRIDLRKKIYLTEDEMRHFLKVAKKYMPCMQTAIAVQYYTGLGRSEIVSTLSISKDKISYRRVKTQKLNTVPVSDELREYTSHLKQGLQRIVPWKHPDTYSHHFAKVVEKAELTGISSHKIRHTFATHALDRGARIEDVSELMGHSSIDITKRFYGHISDERKRETVNLLRLKNAPKTHPAKNNDQ